jgi:hypothetical protein
MKGHILHLYKATDKITVVCIVILELDGGGRIIDSELNDGNHLQELILS